MTIILIVLGIAFFAAGTITTMLGAKRMMRAAASAPASGAPVEAEVIDIREVIVKSSEGDDVTRYTPIFRLFDGPSAGQDLPSRPLVECPVNVGDTLVVLLADDHETVSIPRREAGGMSPFVQMGLGISLDFVGMILLFISFL